MDTWIDMYNKVISIIKNERKKQSDKINKSLRYSQMNLNNLNLNKLKKDLHQFKKDLIKDTKKSKLRYIKKLKKVKYLKLKIII